MSDGRPDRLTRAFQERHAQPHEPFVFCARYFSSLKAKRPRCSEGMNPVNMLRRRPWYLRATLSTALLLIPFFLSFFSLGLLLAMTPRYRIRAPGPRLAYRNILAGFWGNCKYLEILHRGSPEVFRSSSYTLYLPQLKTMAFNAEGEKVEANFCKKRQMKQKKRNHAGGHQRMYSA